MQPIYCLQIYEQLKSKIKTKVLLTQNTILPRDISRKCIYGWLELQFKLAMSASIKHRFCNTSFKILQSKRNFISTSLAIFNFWPLIYPSGKQMTDFIKEFVITKPCYYPEAAHSVFNGYTKFKTFF